MRTKIRDLVLTGFSGLRRVFGLDLNRKVPIREFFA